MLARTFAAVCIFGAALLMADPLGAQEAKQTDLVVAIPPVAAYLPIILGHEKGFYKEAGINLTIDPNIVGAQLVPAVLSGKVQASGLIWPLLGVGAAQGLPLKAVSALSVSGDTTESDEQQLVVLAKSGIKSAADLAGKTVAVNTIKNISEALVRDIVEKAGADPKSVKITPILFPNMLATLRAGSVDAATINEPFLTLAKEQEDIRVIAGVFLSLQPFAPSGIMIMSSDFIEKNPDAVARFQRATKKAVDYAAADANQAEVRLALTKYTRTPANIASKMVLPRFRSFHDIKDAQRQIDVLLKYGILEKGVDVSAYDAQMKP